MDYIRIELLTANKQIRLEPQRRVEVAAHQVISPTPTRNATLWRSSFIGFPAASPHPETTRGLGQAMDTSLLQLITLLQQAEGLILDKISIGQLLGFCSLTAALKDDISQAQHIQVSRIDAPEYLPPEITAFLQASLGLLPTALHGLWSSLGKVIWDYDPQNIVDVNKQLFRDIGWSMSLGE